MDEIARLGFQPAFLDFATQVIHPSRVADGRPLIAGFVRGGFFYTRRAAARAAEQWGPARKHHSTP